ncbi:SLATT domain-containing protein [Saccharibacillus sacchari]|uniref:SLATT domain-containing protein n=1 Tax=Saccharibacillus sacchari TaxID=456493 RepID=UPI00056236A7|nr:SLATT domain-containing protein [Saccharibacillus sacchari]
MSREEFLKLLASRGYNIYFGAKKHLSTYDIIEKFPRFIALIGVSIGVVQLWKSDIPYSDLISLALVIISIISYTITQYDGEKNAYNDSGKALTRLHDDLKALYLAAKSETHFDYERHKPELTRIMNDYSRLSISKQIFFSHTLAHIKFFGESQIEWMNDELKFKFWKDKVPGIYKIMLLLLVTLIVLIIIVYLFQLLIDYIV